MYGFDIIANKPIVSNWDEPYIIVFAYLSKNIEILK